MNNEKDLSKLLRVIGDPRRIKILALLMTGVQCNCEIGNKLQMAPNLISHHLGVLRKVGLVDVERDPGDARWLYYSINAEAVNKLLLSLNEFFDLKSINVKNDNCGPWNECDSN